MQRPDPLYNRKLLRLVIPGLIFLILWSQAGSVLIHICQSVHYGNVRSASSSSDPYRDTILIPRNLVQNVKWVKNDEIFFNNRMFDVKRVITHGEYVAFVGHYDKKDDSFRSLIARFFDTSESNKSPDGNNISFLAFEAIIPSLVYYIYPVVETEERTSAVFHSPFYGLNTLEPAFQPPEIARSYSS